MRNRHPVLLISLLVLIIVLIAAQAFGRNPIRRSFFDTYTSAAGTRLDDLTSNKGHCGVCHYDFDGGGTRNWYGAAVEVAIPLFPDEASAILSIENNDSDGDGYSNLIEITSLLFRPERGPGDMERRVLRQEEGPIQPRPAALQADTVAIQLEGLIAVHLPVKRGRPPVSHGQMVTNHEVRGPAVRRFREHNLPQEGVHIRVPVRPLCLPGNVVVMRRQDDVLDFTVLRDIRAAQPLAAIAIAAGLLRRTADKQ